MVAEELLKKAAVSWDALVAVGLEDSKIPLLSKLESPRAAVELGPNPAALWDVEPRVAADDSVRKRP